MSNQSTTADLPDKKSARAALNQLQSSELAPYWLSAIIESADDAIISKTLDGVITSWNKGAERIFGYTAEEAIGQHVTMLIPEDHPDEEPAIIARLRAGQRIEHYETIRVRKDGSFVDISLTVSPIIGSDGKIMGASKVARDITERKRVEAELQRRERELTDFIENSTVGLHWVGADGRILWANQAELDLLGYTREEYIGHHIAEFHVDEPVISDILCRLMDRESLHDYEARLRCKDGSFRYVLINSNVMWEGDNFVHTRCFTRDITERRLAEEAVRESEQQLRTLADAVPQLVWMAEPDGHIFWYNQRWYDYTGTTPEQIMGWGWQSVHDPEILPRVMERWRVSLDTGEPFEMEFPIKGADGVFRWFLTRVNPLRDSQGRIVRWFGTNTDVDEQRQTAHELREANRLKDEFLAIVSHELRTPLTAILGWAHMLRAGRLDEASAAKALETVERNAHAQTQLIDDLLDVSRIITGQLRLDVRQVDPAYFIESAIEALRPAAEAKAIRVQKVLDTGVVSVAGDPVRLQQVVWNLLSNAIKFTPRDGRVQVRLERINSHIEIAVSDTGAGIKPEFLPHVFERFRQADQRTTRQHGGLGLGLAIVRHLVELHGGTVEAESLGEGHGATFIVKLPVVPVYQKENVVERPHPPTVREKLPVCDSPERLDGLKVLVIDDEPDARELLNVGLGQCGAIVTVAASVQEALEAIEKEKPDLLISDIGMPLEDGYDLIRRVRALPSERGGRVPAIALTAYARIEDRMKALRSGYQMHVPKPVDLAELIAVASSLIQRDS